MARNLYIPPFEVDAIPDTCKPILLDSLNSLLGLRARIDSIDPTKRPRARKMIESYVKPINAELFKREIGGSCRG